MMAQAFSPQRVLGSEERSRHYGRASMDGAEGKRTSQGTPSTVSTLKTPRVALQDVKDERFSTACSAAW